MTPIRKKAALALSWPHGLQSARHAPHAKADLQFLDAVLGVLAPLAVPDQHIGNASGPVAGDDVIARMAFFQQIRLMTIAHHDEPEGLVCLATTEKILVDAEPCGGWIPA